MYTLQSGKQHAIAFHENQRGELSVSDTCGSLKVSGGKPGQGYPAVAFRAAGQDGFTPSEVSPPLTSTDGGGTVPSALAFNLRGREGGAMPEVADVASLRSASGGSSKSYVATMAVRRLLPVECERLQGFPDGFTDVNGAKDGPRYKALGNSMAVNVMRWLGERISKLPNEGNRHGHRCHNREV